MTTTEELSVVIKVMHLLRTGKINAETTNINVLRIIRKTYGKERIH